MARLHKPVELHLLNGNPSKKRLPVRASLAMPVHNPISDPGDPPSDMDAMEKEVWHRLVMELGCILNSTNRSYLELAVHDACRLLRLRKCFKQRRALCRKNKQPEAYAELDDDNPSKRHPLIASLREARTDYASSLGNLGASPSVQAKLLDYIESSIRRREKAKRDADEQYLT